MPTLGCLDAKEELKLKYSMARPYTKILYGKALHNDPFSSSIGHLVCYEKINYRQIKYPGNKKEKQRLMRKLVMLFNREWRA